MITVKEPYEDTSYTFTVGSFYHYPAALAVFLPIEAWRSVFEKPDTYFNGYFSETEITDLDEGYIGATITKDDLTKISRQLKVSMGSMFYLINIFSIVLFVLLIYLLTKLIIEKNATSISMVKILGYETREIMSLYLTATTWIVVLSILISFWIATVLIGQIYVLMMAEFSGWLTLSHRAGDSSEDVPDGNGGVLVCGTLAAAQDPENSDGRGAEECRVGW